METPVITWTKHDLLYERDNQAMIQWVQHLLKISSDVPLAQIIVDFLILKLVAGTRVRSGRSLGVVAAVTNGVPRLLFDGSQLVSFTPDDFPDLEIIDTDRVEISQEVSGIGTVNVGQCVRVRPDGGEWRNGVVTHVRPVTVMNADDSDDEFDATGFEYDEIIDDSTGEIINEIYIWEMN